VGSLIELLGALGLTAGATRTVLSRMTRKGWLRSRREGRRSFYRLSAKGRRLLEDGEKRIYQSRAAEPWSGTWCLIAYSIPEGRRSLRDRLRVRLSWLGFGSLGNGLWISPHPVRDDVRDVAEALGVLEHLEVFEARHVGLGDAGRLVRQCWDLTRIDARYREFLATHAADFVASRKALAAGALDRRACFVRRFQLIHEYREFLFLDPFLPAALLPEDWEGERAARLFRDYHDLLVEPADRFVDGVLSREREPAAPAPAGGS
jgi:phenylacetic acid degradation operon negative regulatory protein